ncbi:MAG: S8 family serine peptidase [Accumulibacter sp.]
MNRLKLPVPDNGASRQVMSGQATYNDPLLASSYWYLGDASGLVNGANVVRVWDDYRGAGVIVAVIDDGVEYTHPDLVANYRSDLDYDTRDLDADASPGDSSDRHGTTVSGVIAAALNNGAGGAGVAPEAGIVGYRIGFGANGTLDQLLAAFQRLTAVDVANNSWGFDGYFGDNFLDPEFMPIGDALATALAEGRGGLGTIVVMAAGNARTSGQDVNYHGFQNHRGTISVAATDSGGNVTYYSTPGAALLVAAPGHGITTTDRVGGEGYASGDYATVSGTSFAAPVVSGIAALMLDANPGLGWRDVQEILAATAVRTGSPASWSFNAADNWNGGAMHVSHDYGFGLVDAHAAVRVAESWRSVSTSGNEWVAEGVQYPPSPIAIPDGGSLSSTITLAAGLRIDRVELDLALVHPYLAQLRVTPTAPDGAESVLVHNPSTSQGSIYFTFSTTRDWGESSGGDWTLTVSDTQLGATGVGYAWGIRAYGDLAGDDTYLYSGEFAALAVADSSRRVLSDAGGMDTVNTAAIAGDTLLDLRPGYASLIAGQEVTIAAGTIIENAGSGDGNDTPAAPATAPPRASPATSCSSSPCLLSIPSSEEGILVRTTSAGKNAGWLPVTAMKNGGGTSNNPSHRRRLLLSSLTSLDSGLRRNDEPGLLDVPLHGCC